MRYAGDVAAFAVAISMIVLAGFNSHKQYCPAPSGRSVEALFAPCAER
jgi:hypothetical protein